LRPAHPFNQGKFHCQQYTNCRFSAGFVSGHPVDTLYLQAEKDGMVTTQLLLRPDEMAAIAWLASGVLWSVTVEQVDT
jgi:hypothetical protein